VRAKSDLVDQRADQLRGLSLADGGIQQLLQSLVQYRDARFGEKPSAEARSAPPARPSKARLTNVLSLTVTIWNSLRSRLLRSRAMSGIAQADTLR
jgi:hypothetical protein